MNFDPKNIKAAVDGIFEETVRIRRQLHQNPELSEHEEKTEALICDHLSALDIPYEKHIAGHGVCGVIYGQDRGLAVGVRADIDALPLTEMSGVPFASRNPGVMHACGHDIHTAVLLGTAMVLSKIKKELPFSVRLFFQPAEETTGGALRMIEAGCMRDPIVRDVIGLHVEPAAEAGTVRLTPGAVNAASCEFSVTVRGVSCHGAHPSTGLDPLIPACEMVGAIQSVITRRLLATDSAIITVGQFHSGNKNNIIPSETRFSGIIRTLENRQRTFLKEELRRVCEGVAAAHNTTCEIEFTDSYPALINDEGLFEIMKKSSEEILGREKVAINKTPSLGCDDFSYFCDRARGFYYNIGTARPGEISAAPIHNEFFCPDESSVRTGILTEVWGVLNIMEAMKKNDR